jgi:hypothetical protein
MVVGQHYGSYGGTHGECGRAEYPRREFRRSQHPRRMYGREMYPRRMYGRGEYRREFVVVNAHVGNLVA